MRAATLVVLCCTAFLAGGISPVARADCGKDQQGEVWCGMGQCERDQYGKVFCSRYLYGGAMQGSDGKVRCGRGQCARDQYANVYCSKAVAGGALRNSEGEVRCAGGCERGSTDYCIEGKK
ncbi:MAG: hypothetical protein LJE74_07170 [Proteobacteria bacterium]|jgi:hypothetical protein|nr:hypothetical protein [Pseudomonadota bacterium]MCG6935819.1 hypothetical protein [Pseudomonadota bacterium]